MKFLALSALVMALTTGAGWAKPGTPGPDYFAGSYEIIGRTGQGDLYNGRAQIVPMGAQVRITSCLQEDVVMAFGPAFEVENLMTGTDGGDRVACLFHNNGYNRPLLTCRSDGGAAFTLWPLEGAQDLPC